MKLILILSILMSGCTSIPHLDKWRVARRNFRYMEDIEGEILAYDRIDREFWGDCDDFAATLKKQIGGDMFAVKYQGYWHAVLVKDGFVLVLLFLLLLFLLHQRVLIGLLLFLRLRS